MHFCMCAYLHACILAYLHIRKSFRSLKTNQQNLTGAPNTIGLDIAPVPVSQIGLPGGHFWFFDFSWNAQIKKTIFGELIGILEKKRVDQFPDPESNFGAPGSHFECSGQCCVAGRNIYFENRSFLKLIFLSSTL